MFRTGYLFASIVIATPAFADSAPGEKSQLMKATELARWGEEHFSAEALAAAAQMACGLPNLVVERVAYPRDSEPPGEGHVEPLVPLHDKWLAQAKRLAEENDDRHLARHLEAARCIKKGVQGGPIQSTGWIEAGQSLHYNVQAVADENLEITVKGQGLALILYSSDWQMLNLVRDSSAKRTLVHLPSTAGSLWISVVNEDDVIKDFELKTN
jgi:hypothetical protein